MAKFSFLLISLVSLCSLVVSISVEKTKNASLTECPVRSFESYEIYYTNHKNITPDVEYSNLLQNNNEYSSACNDLPVVECIPR